MRPGGGKGKGNAWERQVCKDLSLWYTQGKMADVFWRSAMSGGRATVRAKKDKTLAHVAGDICAVHSSGQPFIDRFYVECKAYRDMKIAQAVTKGEGRLLKFWRDTKKKAEQFGKQPILIFRQTQFPAMVGMTALTLADWGAAPMVSFHEEDLYLLSYDKAFTFRRPRRPRFSR
jgi:hypothetical protein